LLRRAFAKMVSRVGMLALLVLVLARVHAVVGAHAELEQPSAGAVPIVRTLPPRAVAWRQRRELPETSGRRPDRRFVRCAENVIGRFRFGSCLPQGAHELREERWEPLGGGVVRAGEPTVVRHARTFGYRRYSRVL
jgi:hypothetical protein